MTHRTLKFIRFTASALLALTGVYAGAAQVTAQHHSGFQRLNFSFGQPAHLKVEANGNNLVLHFDAPVKESPAEITGLLKGYATSASISSNGHVTLIMNKQYRIRQFVSGGTVGVDIIGAESAPTQTAQATPPAPEVLTTKKPVAPPSPPKAEPKKLAAIAKPTPVKPAPQPAPAPAVVNEKTATTPAKPAPVIKETITTTKPTPTPAKEAAPAAKPVEEVVAAKLAAASKPGAEPKIVENDSGPFTVTARTKDSETTLHFPYRQRTAVAVFERARDIWVVFSKAENVNVSLLRTILPKSVIDVTQYDNTENTILRFSTDGTVHANAQPVKERYSWNIVFAPSSEPPTLDTPITEDSTDNASRLLLGAYDVSAPLQFYDPNVGDLLIIIPSYESGRGVAHARHFPELDMLLTNQGLAIASARDDLRTTLSRLGVSVESKDGLAVSKSLFVQSVHAGLASGTASGILLPYEQWYIPSAKFHDTLADRLAALSAATKDTRSDALYSLATLYLGQGMGSEALGYLQMINSENPEFYKARHLALLNTAAEMLENRPEEAATSLASPELADVKEAELWREYLSLFAVKPNAVQQAVQAATPAAPVVNPYNANEDQEAPGDTKGTPVVATPAPLKPLMHFLKYNKSYIHFYPPRIRQQIASAAADAYIENGLYEKALATFDTLNRDEILEPVRHHAEYVLGLVAIRDKKNKDAQQIFERLSKQKDDPEMRARARFSEAMLLLNTGKATPEETVDTLQSIRTSWRGDAIERKILLTLAQIGKDSKHYDDVLRALKTYVDEFPNDPAFLAVAGEMGDLFEQLYLNGLADEMPPLKSLSLFYEFRDLTPIGDKGDAIIQKLADRLAAFDLIDRATQLLENQIAFRVSGQTRSQVGARLALLYLLNHQPKEALRVLEVTNYGQNPAELQRQRLELTAQALNESGRHEDALNVLYNDNSNEGELLKLDILWAAQDWPNMVNRAEEILSKRPDLTAKLNPTETEVLLKLALGYSFEGDYNQLRYLRDYYSSLLTDTAYKPIFDYITNDTAPLDREDTTMLTQQISHTESFLDTFKAKIAAGKLSEAIK